MVNGNIKHYLTRNPGYDRLTAIQEVAAGIAYLHSLWIVHGDIKPQNILVDEDGRCRLADFGLANAAAEISTAFSPSDPNRGGTLRYMAPELLLPTTEPDEPCKEKTDSFPGPGDIYAYGCTVYELVTGELPFSNLPEGAVIVQVAYFGARPSRPRDAGWCSDDVWALIEQCWHQDARARPSAQDVEASAKLLQQ
ncbi:MAP kinase kinase kinase activity protein [Marasmius tenuissimus]|nr:MAP kinase kinase kinase activity protein [Marasmius tenuissimus]